MKLGEFAGYALCVTACLAASMASRATAQDEPRDRAAARALFHEGVECSDRDDWTCAIDRFQRAYDLRPSLVIASNLGHALVHAGRLVEAAEMLGEVVRSDAAPDQLRTDARATLAEIEPRLGRLTVRVAGSTVGVVLTLDGRSFPESLVGVAGPSDPGDHTLVAQRDGREVATAQVHVEPGTEAEVAITVPELPRLTVDDRTAEATLEGSLTSPPPRATELYEEWWLWTIVGVVVAGAVGTTVGVLAAPGPALPAGSLGTIDAR